jgi:hypothetical protein
LDRLTIFVAESLSVMSSPRGCTETKRCERKDQFAIVRG